MLILTPLTGSGSRKCARRRKLKALNGDSYSRVFRLWTWAACMVLGNHPLSQNAIRHIVNFSPGRLFATNEVKAMLAHVLLNYDVKMANVSVGISSIPDPTSEVMFRKWMPARGLWMPLYRDALYLIFGWSLSL